MLTSIFYMQLVRPFAQRWENGAKTSRDLSASQKIFRAILIGKNKKSLHSSHYFLATCDEWELSLHIEAVPPRESPRERLREKTNAMKATRSNVPQAAASVVPAFINCGYSAREAFRRASHVIRFELRCQEMAA